MNSVIKNLTLLLILISFCSKNTFGQEKIDESLYNKYSKTKGVINKVLKDEVNRTTLSLIDSLFLNIGNSHFALKVSTYSSFKSVVQLYNFTYSIIPDSLTTTDSLNFFTWKGKIIIEFDAYRNINSDYGSFSTDEWQEWNSGKQLIIEIAKKRGKWKFYVENSSFIGNRKPSKELINRVLLSPMSDTR